MSKKYRNMPRMARYLSAFAAAFAVMATHGAVAQEPIKIGVNTPVSGVVAVASEREMQGVNLAVEELFTNMVKFNPDGDEHISLQLQHADASVRVRLCDRRVEPFDVTVPRIVDRDAPVERRETGGLGLYLVQQMVDSLDYAHRDGVTTVTFTKNLG